MLHRFGPRPGFVAALAVVAAAGAAAAQTDLPPAVPPAAPIAAPAPTDLPAAIPPAAPLAPVTAPASPYSVSDVAVEATAATATAARDDAFRQGQRRALEQLLQQRGADPAVAAQVSAGELEAMIERFQVQSERTSPGRYSAVLSYTFRPSAIDRLAGPAPAVAPTMAPGLDTAVPGGLPSPTPGTSIAGLPPADGVPPAAMLGPQSMTVLVPIAGAADWFDTQARLARLSGAAASSVISLSVREAIVELRYGGGEAQLRQALAAQGLALEQGPQAVELRRIGGF